MDSYQNPHDSVSSKSFIGNSFIDLAYFQTFKQTYKSSSHPHNHFFRVTGSSKNTHFVELFLDTRREMQSMESKDVQQSLSINSKINPAKIQKAKDFVQALQNCDSVFQEQYHQDHYNPTDEERRHSFQKAEQILLKRQNKLLKYNIFWKPEGKQTPIFLKTGISQSALAELQMSDDFYEHVHLRFGIAPFLDKFYAKNFIQINTGLLLQDKVYSARLHQSDSFINKNKKIKVEIESDKLLQLNKLEESSSLPRQLSNQQISQISHVIEDQIIDEKIEDDIDILVSLGKKLPMNLSSVGAIYNSTEFELFDIGYGFFLDIHYYQNAKILRDQVHQINKNLRIKNKEQIYTQSSAEFVTKYYPKVRTWATKNNKLEVDSDIIQKLLCKRTSSMVSLESENRIRMSSIQETSSNIQGHSSPILSFLIQDN